MKKLINTIGAHRLSVIGVLILFGIQSVVTGTFSGIESHSELIGEAEQALNGEAKSNTPLTPDYAKSLENEFNSLVPAGEISTRLFDWTPYLQPEFVKKIEPKKPKAILPELMVSYDTKLGENTIKAIVTNPTLKEGEQIAVPTVILCIREDLSDPIASIPYDSATNTYIITDKQVQPKTKYVYTVTLKCAPNPDLQFVPDKGIRVSDPVTVYSKDIWEFKIEDVILVKNNLKEKKLTPVVKILIRKYDGDKWYSRVFSHSAESILHVSPRGNQSYNNLIGSEDVLDDLGRVTMLRYEFMVDGKKINYDTGLKLLEIVDKHKVKVKVDVHSMVNEELKVEKQEVEQTVILIKYRDQEGKEHTMQQEPDLTPRCALKKCPICGKK